MNSNFTNTNKDFENEEDILKKYTGAGGDIVIPDGVAKIGLHAFCGCKNLTSVTIPGSVKKFALALLKIARISQTLRFSML